MHGNVLEWVQDTYRESYMGAPTDGSAWRKAPSSRTYCVYRGGCWFSFARDCRSAFRIRRPPDFHYPSVGLRPAATLP